MRATVAVLAVLLAVLVLCLPACAEDGRTPDGYSDLLDGIPRDVAELLPDGIFSEDMGEVQQAVREMSGFSWLFRTVGDLIGSDVEGALSLFAKLTGVLVLAALLSTVRGAMGSEGLSRAVELCGSCAVAGSLLSLTSEAVLAAESFLARLSTLANAMIPVMGALYAMGGNVGTAVVANSGMMMFLHVVENLCAATLTPVAGICVALAVAGAMFGGGSFRGVGNFVKKIYTFFLGLVMLILTFTLSVQTALAAGADGVAMKSAKLLAGRAIPVVGGSVGDTLRTVAGSIAYIKTTVGALGVVVVALMLLPPLITVILYRLGLIAAASCADVLGCSAESRLLDAFVTVFGYLLAVLCVCSAVMIFLIALFVKCSVALA